MRAITFMALDWPYSRAWQREPVADFRFMSSHWMPSGVGEAAVAGRGDEDYTGGDSGD